MYFSPFALQVIAFVFFCVVLYYLYLGINAGRAYERIADTIAAGQIVETKSIHEALVAFGLMFYYMAAGVESVLKGHMDANIFVELAFVARQSGQWYVAHRNDHNLADLGEMFPQFPPFQ